MNNKIATIKEKLEMMTPENFCYWLQGFFELTNSDELTKIQIIEIKKHLHNVFVHKCQSYKYDPNTFLVHSDSIPQNINYPQFPLDLLNPNNPPASC